MYLDFDNVLLGSTSGEIISFYFSCELCTTLNIFLGLPPIKVTQKKQYMTRTDGNELEPIRGRLSSHWDNNTHFQERQKCLQLFIGDFGYNALYESQVRLDPLLFKDDVARFRKRYPNIDSVEP